MTHMGRLSLALPLFLAVVSGCSNSSTPSNVYGKITYNGTPVTSGSLTFHTEAGGIYPRAITESGYSLTDLPEGTMVVTIETETANPNPKKQATYSKGKDNPQDEYRNRMQEMGKVPQGATNVGGPYVQIPDKYSAKTSSPLRVTLTKGGNECNFNLTD